MKLQEVLNKFTNQDFLLTVKGWCDELPFYEYENEKAEAYWEKYKNKKVKSMAILTTNDRPELIVNIEDGDVRDEVVSEDGDGEATEEPLYQSNLRFSICDVVVEKYGSYSDETLAQLSAEMRVPFEVLEALIQKGEISKEWFEVMCSYLKPTKDLKQRWERFYCNKDL